MHPTCLGHASLIAKYGRVLLIQCLQLVIVANCLLSLLCKLSGLMLGMHLETSVSPGPGTTPQEDIDQKDEVQRPETGLHVGNP